MIMEVLNVLFGGKARVRIMRLFLLNPDTVYTAKLVASLCRLKLKETEREVQALGKVGLLKHRHVFEESSKQKKRKRVLGWTIDPSFIYISQLRNLLVNSVLLKARDIVRRLSRGGLLRAIVLSGIFINQWESRVDILIVGDRMKRGAIERALSELEVEIGRELRYSILDTSDFQFRLGMGDKLVRDVFDYPHQVVLNRGVILS